MTSTPDASWLFDPSAYADGIPDDRFALLRALGPLHWSETKSERGCWNVVRHAGVVAALKDWTTYSSHQGGTTIADQTQEQVGFNRSLLHVDPPEHGRLRSAFAPTFRRREAAASSELFEAIATALVDEVLSLGTFDAVTDLATRMVSYSLWELLGGATEARDYFLRLSALMLGDMVPRAGTVDYARLALPPGGSRRVTRSPSEAMIDLLRSTGDDGRIVHRKAWSALGLTDREIEDLLIILATAGTGMTQNAIAMTLMQASLHWEAIGAARDGDAAALSGLVEEGLRFATPLMYVRRTATVDHVLHGTEIRAGDKVVLWLASANFDAEVFDDPLRFSAGRNPNPHVSFGRGGPHFCLGAWLAREEMTALFRLLLPRVRAIRLVERPTRTTSSFVNEMSRMMLEVTPR